MQVQPYVQRRAWDGNDRFTERFRLPLPVALAAARGWCRLPREKAKRGWGIRSARIGHAKTSISLSFLGMKRSRASSFVREKWMQGEWCLSGAPRPTCRRRNNRQTGPYGRRQTIKQVGPYGCIKKSIFLLSATMAAPRRAVCVTTDDCMRATAAYCK